jgi:ABC-2 type transport system ATP-binding protein
MTPVPAISAENLRKTYLDFWRRPRVEAVRGISFAVPPGAVYGLLGPNGSGKSTTVKMVLGLLFPTSGTLRVYGLPPGTPAARRRIGYLPEETHLHPVLTPREILTAHASFFRLPRAAARDRIAQLAAMLRLETVLDRAVGSFSKGMARRVGLAQTLLHDPDLLILDEPTSGLDPQGTRQVKDLLSALAARGKTVLMTSHLLADVQDVCSRVAILRSGTLLAEGPLDDLLARRDRTRLTFPTPDDPSLPDALRDALAARLGGVPVTLSHPRASLEDYYLSALDLSPAPSPLPPFLQPPPSPDNP